MKLDFEQNGYFSLQSVISTELQNFITQYALYDELQDFNPDENQVFNAHSKYADPAMETVLSLLHPIMEKNTGLTLFPTYSFYRVYRPGDILKIHTDRPSCEISCTLCFGFKYNDEKYRWPIVMDGVELKQNPGDMSIYRGCYLPHWRDEFIGDKNDWHVQGFFHYVDANGPYAEFKYDKRTDLGYSVSSIN